MDPYSVKRFFQWLAWQPGYKSRFQYADAEYFNLTNKDTRIATAKRQQRLRPWNKSSMSSARCRRHRDRAPESRLSRIYSADRSEGPCHCLAEAEACRPDCRLRQPGCPGGQDEFSKTFNTFFFPVGEEVREIVSEWVTYLRMKSCGAMRIRYSRRRASALGLRTSLKRWTGAGALEYATAIRRIFREAFERAGLPYFNPHSFRNTLVQLGEEVCRPRAVQGVESEPGT